MAEGYIRLDVTVTDKAGKPVTGLGAEDFSLLDNGQATKLVSFHGFDESAARPDPPTEAILVIDTVNLSPQQVTTADREVEKFLRANGGQLAQPTVIYRLSGWGLKRSGAASSGWECAGRGGGERKRTAIGMAAPGAGDRAASSRRITHAGATHFQLRRWVRLPSKKEKGLVGSCCSGLGRDGR